MEDQKRNIENAVRDKFEGYSPSPPEHVWEGIAAGLASGKAAAATTKLWRNIGVAASVLLLLGVGFWWFMPKDDQQSRTEPPVEAADSFTDTGAPDTPVAVEDSRAEKLPDTSQAEEIADNAAGQDYENETVGLIAGEEEVAQSTTPELTLQEHSGQDAGAAALDETSAGGPGMRETEAVDQPIHALPSFDGTLETGLPEAGTQPFVMPPTLQNIATQERIRGWTHNVYFTPEVMLNDFDSVTLLPVYALNYEPAYHFNEHLFLRFGAGLQYARDRGFAKIDMIRNEVVGSYEDVYDVTFDSIDGNLIPTYHTQTRDIWDSVRRIVVSETTNKYLYLQVPVLLGYYNRGQKVSWYLYGGPAINMKVSEWIADPQDEYSDASIIDLRNNLPERSSYYFQLWVGGGINYAIDPRFSLALEPTYRYYFNQVFKEEPYRQGFSGLGLRIGVVYQFE